MDVIMALAAAVFIGFTARTLYLLLREERKKDLLLTTAMWGLALVVWGLYLITVKGKTQIRVIVVMFGLTAFLLSFIGLFRLLEESPSEFGKEL
ncbi:hypothetical protein [Thermococcus peptonophilus]|uniref:Uncharacterized protein n=1 Tax=Thermococcus peptonophilus TaxID=53952 RepID=A0A142CVZ0_9EURY|nr:hypothetical protein [Thermococcus peptonophilus]AMQ18942.1 hypothetical protein A0127_07045 [Thermococcus peptonophilus]